jgi:low density lipoprotein-related protein 2
LNGKWEKVEIEVEWVGEKLYVADSVGQKVDVFELDGNWNEIVIGRKLRSNEDIELDKKIG